MTKRFHLSIAPILLGLSVLAAGCANGAPFKPQSTEPTGIPVAKAPVLEITDLPLQDKQSLYAEYDPTELTTFYITVRKGNAADGTDNTFEQVNAYENPQESDPVEKVLAEALVQEGDASGPLPGHIGYGERQSNATINVRGRTSSIYPQKSYRLDLMPSAGLWRGQRAIALNKHPADATRIRNMLFFTLLQNVPDLTSLRVQYVHLYVKDETSDPPQDQFVDFGLYTQVELPNGRYLRNHDLSRNGNLYKANFFEMYRYPEVIRLANDPLYDRVAFNQYLEPKTTEDHTKLIEMLDAVNDDTRPIEEVIAKHFDLGNLTSYLAFNMLMANPDSNAQNHLLYSPVNSSKWYYINWDGDGALSYYEDELMQSAFRESPWTRGISDYWGIVLFRRMLKVPQYRQLLHERVELLRQTINPESVRQLIKKLRPVPDRFVAQMPDQIHLQLTQEQRNQVLDHMADDTELGYQYYLESLQKPMPFFMASPVLEGKMLNFAWDASYDFGDGLLHYDFQVAKDWTFSTQALIFESLNQTRLSAQIPLPEAGTYYFRVIVRNDKGMTQVPFDQVLTRTGVHHGMMRFTITHDGKVLS